MSRLTRQAGFDRYPTVNIGGFIRDVPTDRYPTKLQLQIYLPWEMDAHPGRTYPVVYICDGQWDAPLLYCIYSHLLFDRAVPDFIIVGLCHGGEKNANVETDRKRDLAPPSKEEIAGRSDFLARLSDQVIPLVENDYPADPTFRCLAGTSLGALFTLGALFREPGLFQAAIAVSPIVGAYDGWLFELERGFAGESGGIGRRIGLRGPKLPARVFMAVGERDYPDTLAAARRFEEQLDDRRYRFLEKRLHVAPGEGHGGTKPEGLNRGLRFVFDGFREVPD